MTVADVAEGFADQGDPSGGDHPGGATDAELGDAIADVDSIEDEPTSILDHLKRAPDGSIEDANASEMFSIEEGAEDRLALVAEDVLSSEGVPNWLHLTVAAIEIAIKHGDHDLPIPSGDDRADEVAP